MATDPHAPAIEAAAALLPAPGSIAAVHAGCKCPVLDNNYGRGIGGGLFWIDGECPLHAAGKHKADHG